MKLAVVGSRGFNDYKILKEKIDWLRSQLNIDSIVSGAAKGADSLAAQYAFENHLNLIEFPANWKKFGKRAGFIRNEDIWKEADLGIAFWDGESKGTSHSLKLSEKYEKPLYIYNFKTKEFYLYSSVSGE